MFVRNHASEISKYGIQRRKTLALYIYTQKYKIKYGDDMVRYDGVKPSLYTVSERPS